MVKVFPLFLPAQGNPSDVFLCLGAVVTKYVFKNLRPAHQLPEHVGENASMLEVIHLDRGVDAEQELYFPAVPVFAFDHEGSVLQRPEAAQTYDIELLIALDRERLN